MKTGMGGNRRTLRRVSNAQRHKPEESKKALDVGDVKNTADSDQGIRYRRHHEYACNPL